MKIKLFRVSYRSLSLGGEMYEQRTLISLLEKKLQNIQS